MHFSLNKYITVVAFIVLSSFATRSMAFKEVMHINFQFDKKSLPVANININGENQTFIIDTGSTTALHLSKNVSSKISGLVIEPEKFRSTDLAGKVFFNEKFKIPQISINGMVFNNIKGISLTPWGMSLTQKDTTSTSDNSLSTSDNYLPTSMVIGLDLFKGKVVLVDYKNQRLSVSDNLQALGINTDDSWSKLPLILTQEGAIVKVTQNAKSYNMILDTASTISIFWKKRIKSVPVNIPCQAVLESMKNEGCTASTFQLENTGVKKIKLNSVLLDGDFNQLNADGIIGNNFFKKHIILIDFVSNQLLIKEIS
ncbi:aspartyl protease family protein [Xenorhabdus thailandensis]|uniref:aspartyl protease family protein n=1 Tax=Xenorhabdus thailandensis TaxID=3136255 RepID=UPI0030F3F78C